MHKLDVRRKPYDRPLPFRPKPCNRNPPEAEKITSYPVLKGWKFFSAHLASKNTLNLTFLYIIAFLCIIDPIVDLFAQNGASRR